MDLEYVPFHLLKDMDNIIVDGRGNENTRLTLSHWPDNDTPGQFKDDLSAQIVFRYIETGTPLDDVRAVSNNHFDEDGLISLYAMLNSKIALEMKDFLVEVARAGDFSKCMDSDAAKVSFVISAWTDPKRSPLSLAAFQGSEDTLNQILYEELLGRFPKIIDKIGNLVEFWQDEDYILQSTQRAIANGLIKIEEDRDLDLAIVILPDMGILKGDSQMEFSPNSWIRQVLHPIAIHNEIDCYRVCVIQKNHYELYYRYETWVDYVSKLLKDRIDLTGLASRLNQEESSGGKWTFNGVDSIIGRLKLDGRDQSSVSPSRFLDYVKAEFASTNSGIR